MTRRISNRLRIAVILLGALQSLAALSIFLLFSGSTDPLGKAIGKAVQMMVLAPFVLLIVPGLALGIIGRWLQVALALLLVAIPVTALLWYFA